MHASYLSILAIVMAKAVASLEPPIPGYGVETLQWKLQVNPGKINVFNGTVQEVYAQLIEINPTFKLQVSTSASVIEEQDFRATAVNCGTFPSANKGRIQEGINYLRGVGGAPRNGPGPGNCGRVSCSYNSAIWWCNDNTTPKTLDSWDWIANSAQHIVNTCASATSTVSGQNFESGNWNTIVRGDSC